MPDIASISIRVNLDLDAFRRDLRGLGSIGDAQGAEIGRKLSDGIARSVSSRRTALSSMFTGIFQGIGQTIALGLTSAITGAVGAVGGLTKKIADAGMTAETTKIQFTTFLGSASEAQRLLRELTTFAANTPFELPEVQSATRSLLAFGVTAKEIPSLLTAVGNVAAGTGTDFSELAQIIGKAKTQGRLFAEDINQLTGRGIPVIAELAKIYGVTESQVKKLVEAGAVGFPQLETAIKNMSAEGGKFNNLMAALSKTTQGRFSNLADQITQSFVKIFDSVKPAIDATLDVLMAGLGATKVDFTNLNTLAKEFAGWLTDHKDEAIALGKAIGTSVNNALQATLAISKDIGNIVENISNFVMDIVRAWQFLNDESQKFNQTIKDAWNTMQQPIQMPGWLKQASEWFGQVTGGLNMTMPVGKYDVRNPNGSKATSYDTSTAHHDYQRTKRGVVKDMTLFQGGQSSVNVPSAISGTVKHAGTMGGYGNAVIVVDKSGQEVLMGHLSKLFVKAGEQVGRGQALGIQGNTGHSTGTHLHIEGPESVVRAYYDMINGRGAKGGPVTAAAANAPDPVLQKQAAAILAKTDDAAKEQRKAEADAQRKHREAMQRADDAADRQRRLRDEQFSLETQRGGIGLTGAQKELFELQRSGITALRQQQDILNDLKTAKSRGESVTNADISAQQKLVNQRAELNKQLQAELVSKQKAADLDERQKAAFEQLVQNHRLQQQYDEAAAENRKKSFEDMLQRDRSYFDIIAKQKEMMENYRAATVRLGEGVINVDMPSFSGTLSGMDTMIQNLDKLQDFTLEPQITEAQELGKALVDNVGGAFKSTLSDLIMGTKSLGAALLDLLGNIAGQLANMALNSMFGSSSGGGILGGLFNTLFGGGDFGIKQSAGLDALPWMAKGGIVTEPTVLGAGEAGPEAIIPLDRLKGMGGGGVNVTVNYTNNAPISNQVDAHKQGDMIAGMVKSVLINEMRPNGLLDKRY